jgi:hypothetical protein
MIIYNVHYRDYKNKKTEIVGALTERRKDPRRGSTLIQSALKWAKIEFGQLVKDANAIFIEERVVNEETPLEIPVVATRSRAGHYF